jgi:hypothetical protein
MDDKKAVEAQIAATADKAITVRVKAGFNRRTEVHGTAAGLTLKVTVDRRWTALDLCAALSKLAVGLMKSRAQFDAEHNRLPIPPAAPAAKERKQ